MSERQLLTPAQAAIEAQFLVESCEVLLRDSAVGEASVVLRAFVTELRRLEWQWKLPTLFGRDSDWLDRYSTVLQAYRELSS